MRETTVVSVFEIPMLLNFWTPDIYNHWCLRKPSVFCICPLNVMSRSSASTDIKPRSSTCQTSDANKSQRNARMFHKPEQSPMSVMSETGRWRSSFPLHKDLCLHGWTQWEKKKQKTPQDLGDMKFHAVMIASHHRWERSTLNCPQQVAFWGLKLINGGSSVLVHICKLFTWL